MTEEEVFRLKPGDLLRVDDVAMGSSARTMSLQTTYAIVVAGAGPNVTLAWQWFAPSWPILSPGHWRVLADEEISRVLHRSRLTRIA